MAKLDTIIKPNLIFWARKRLKMSLCDFAQKMNVSVDKVQGWESGEIPITMPKAKHLASISLLPLGIFFLDDEPNIDLALPDFRSINSANITNASPELEATILAMQEKQDWYKAYLLDNDFTPLTFVNTLNIKTNIQAAAEAIRSVLRTDENFAFQTSNWEAYFGSLIQAIENVGVLFIRNSCVGNNNHRKLDLEEFRGFVLVDEHAPLIFINGNDSKNAQIFTLIHELVHVFLGKSGVTNSEIFHKDANSIEQFCNKVAAEFLAPEETVKLMWNRAINNEENIAWIAKKLKVSKLVIISRCRDLSLISKDISQKLWAQEIFAINLFKAKQHEKSGGNYFATLKYKAGISFAQTVIAETAARRVTYTEAFRLLGVKNVEDMKKLSETVGLPLL